MIKEIFILGFLTLISQPTFFIAKGEQAVLNAIVDLQSFVPNIYTIKDYKPGDSIVGVDQLTCVCIVDSIKELTNAVGHCDFTDDLEAKIFIRSREVVLQVCNILMHKFLQSSEHNKQEQPRNPFGLVGADYSFARRLQIQYHYEKFVLEISRSLDGFFQSIHWDPFFKANFNKNVLRLLKEEMLRSAGLSSNSSSSKASESRCIVS